MEFFFDKFSVIKTEIKARETKKKEDLQKLKQIEMGDKSLDATGITRLIELGFQIEQILLVIKEFKCKNVEEALVILTKDSATQKYNHVFMADKNSSTCAICLDSDKESHLLYMDKSTELIGSKVKASQKNSNNLLNADFNPLNATSNDISHQNLSLGILPNQNNRGLLDDQGNKDRLKNAGQQYIGSSDLPNEFQFDFDDPNLCEICWDQKFDLSSQRDCRHKFCRPCITSYLQHKITNGKVLKIKCLYGGCPSQFSDFDISNYTTPDLFRKYKKFKMEQLKLTDPNSKYVYCPLPDCGNLVRSNNLFDTDLTCENGHVFCEKCLKEAHEGACDSVNLML